MSFFAAAGTCLAAFLVAAMVLMSGFGLGTLPTPLCVVFYDIKIAVFLVAVLMSGFGLGTLPTPLCVVFYDIKIAVFLVAKEGCGRMRGRRRHRHDHDTDLTLEMKKKLAKSNDEQDLYSGLIRLRSNATPHRY